MKTIKRMIPLGLALVGTGAFGCDSVRFAKVEPPTLNSLVAKAPTPPEPQPVVDQETEAKWQVIDASAKAPLRKKLMAVQVSALSGAEIDPVQRAVGTSQLLSKLMAGGFTSVLDLSSAPSVNAEVSRTGGGSTVVLSGALHNVLPVTNPLRAEYVLSVSFAALPGAQGSRQVRFALGDKDLQEYKASYERYQGEVKEYLQRLDSAWTTYQSTFLSSKEEYEKNKGSYSTFPVPTEGQRAVAEHDRVEAQYKQLRAAAEAAKMQPATPESWSQEVAGRKETESRKQVRITGWASIQETMSNRVVWIAWVDHSVSDQHAALTLMLDRLVAALPGESRGAR